MKASSRLGTYEKSDRLQVLWEDGERAFCKVSRDGDSSVRYAIIPAFSGAEPPTPGSIDRLKHKYEPRDYFDSAWALRPVELLFERGVTMMFVEYAGGERLSALLGAPLDIGGFLRLALALSHALGRLHACGFVHKDIKPAHVLVNAATGQVWLTGFGIAS